MYTSILFHIAVVPFIIIVYSNPLFSQSQSFDEDWRWVHFTTESGLPSNHIFHLMETKDGTVWVGTARGVAWYDGYEWREVDSSLGLPQEIVTSMVDDSRDGVLVVTERHLYHGNQSGFVRIPIENVETAIPFLNGSILIFSNTSLYLYSNGKINNYSPKEVLTEGALIKLWKTKGDGNWILAQSGLYRWEQDRWVLKLKSGDNRFDINCIAENKNRSGLISVSFPFNDRGLWEWNNGGLPSLNNSEHGDFIRTMDIDSAGEAIAVYSSGQMRIRINNRWSAFVPKLLELRYVETIQHRSDGDLWALTNDGLFLYRKTVNRWKYLGHDATDPRNRIHEILRARDNSLWLGTADGIEIHKTTGTTTIRQIEDIKLFVVTGLEQDDDGNIWISSGSAFSGAFRWDGSHWKHFQIAQDEKEIRVHKIRKDRHGRLWFLGLAKEDPFSQSVQPGAYVYSKDKFERWGTEDGLVNGRIYAFAEGVNGELWFGTYGGISRWKNGLWSHWTHENGLQLDKIFAIVVDSNNRLWFADRESGLGYITERDEIGYFTSKDGLVNKFVWDLKMDPHGELWISTRGGLGAYYEGQFFSFNYTSGLVNPQLWPVLPEDHQVLVGTMGSGVAILNRDEDPQPQPRIHLEKPATEENTAFLRWHSYAYWGQPAPAEILTRYRINSGTWSEWSTRREVSVDGLEPGECSYQVQAKGLFGNFDPEGVSGKFIIALPLYRHPAVIIPTGSLSILVIILGFVIFIRKKKHNQAIIQSEAKFRGVAETTASAIFIYQGSKFQYLNPGTENLTGYTRNELENLSFSDLIKTKHFRSINPPLSMRNLAELIPGRYEFKITTKGSIERWVDLTIGEVEYQGKPARLGTAFDITDRMELGRKIISYRDQLRSLASELSIAEEKERRRLALILHDTIGQTLAFCKIKLGAYRALQNSVSSAESIDEIRNLIDQSIRDTRSLTLELSPQVLHELGLQKALGWLCEQMKEKHSIDFVFYDDRQPKPLTDELQSVVYHAVRELMINIVKHAQVETAQISLRRNGNQVCILVEDRGVGFDASGVFVNRNGNSGFGLFSIRERLSLLGGHLELSSQHSTGTTATLSVPLRSQQGTAGGQSCE